MLQTALLTSLSFGMALKLKVTLASIVFNVLTPEPENLVRSRNSW